MQSKRAEELRKEWGDDKPCSHPNFDKEYYFGSQTGDYICTQCGRSFTKKEMEEIEYRKK